MALHCLSPYPFSRCFLGRLLHKHLLSNPCPEAALEVPAVRQGRGQDSAFIPLRGLRLSLLTPACQQLYAYCFPSP